MKPLKKTMATLQPYRQGLKNIYAFASSWCHTKRFPSRFSERRDLLEWQERKVIKHVSWVRRNSPFYAKHWRSLADRDWRLFPTVDKKILMANFADWNTVGLQIDQAFRVAMQAENSRDFRPTIGRYSVGLSSGTSGHRGLFIVSPEEQKSWAGTLLAKILPGIPGPWSAPVRIAFFLRANSNLYESLEKGNIQFQYFDMLKQPHEHIARLQALKPTVIIAPPKLLRQLARAQKQGQLNIQPDRLLAVAESLDPLDEQKIAGAFGREVHLGYQATEGFIGVSCNHGSLHLNEDLMVIEREYVDQERKRFIPIITDFRRKSQPIIRYRLNDILTLSDEECACGLKNTVIQQIEGRCDDIFYFPKLNGTNKDLVSIYPDFLRRSLLAVKAPISEYRIEQHALDQVVIQRLYDTSPANLPCSAAQRKTWDQAIQAQLTKLWKGFGVIAPTVSIRDLQGLDAQQKLIRVKQLYTFQH